MDKKDNKKGQINIHKELFFLHEELINFYSKELKILFEAKFAKKKLSFFQKFIFLSLTKLSKTSKAISLLIKEGYFEEAFILSRSNLEILLYFYFILKSNQELKAKVFLDFSDLNYYLQLEKLSNKNPEEFKSFFDRYKKEKYQEIIKIKNDRDILKNLLKNKFNKFNDNKPLFLSTKQLSDELEKEKSKVCSYNFLYDLIFFLQSELVHPINLNYYLIKDNKDNIYYFNDEISQNDLDKQTLIANCFIFIFILKKTSDFLKLGIEKRLEDFENNLIKLIKIFNNKKFK